MKRHIAISVLSIAVVLMLVRVVMMDGGNDIEIIIVKNPPSLSDKYSVRRLKPSPTQAFNQVIHDPDSWKTRSWYTTTGYKQLPRVLKQKFGDETTADDDIFKLRFNQIEAELSKGSNLVEISSASHPACSSQSQLQKEGRLSTLYPKEIPCSRYPFGQSTPIPWNEGKYQIARNIVVYNDELYTLEGEDDHPPRNRSIKWAGQFVTLRGFVNQVTTDSIELKPLPKELRSQIASMETREVALYQPATDFAALWHTVVEVALPLFHAALPYLQNGYNISIVQQLSLSRTVPPPIFRELYKQRGLTWTCCALSPSTCMSTAYGGLYQKLASGGLIFNQNKEEDRPILFRRMIFGTPTNCVPVWGIDALFQAATGTVDEECAALFWAWRKHWLDLYKSRKLSTISLPIRAPEVVILWASRKGSESRRIDNENELMGQVGDLISKPVVVTNFAGTLSEQFTLLQSATHLVSPHGAALVNVIMLRVNSFVVMLDIHFPPFTGFAMEVPWVHHIHYSAELTCNPSHYKNSKKKRCKHIYTKPEGMHHVHNFATSEHNNNIKGGPGLIDAINSTLFGCWDDLSAKR